jgi:transcriptional regulator with XRE-family HTH domain/Zn-dependent peptidase ImmA (M78 family)
VINKSVLKFVLSLKIRRLRQKKAMSLKELAQKSGLSHSYLNEIEKGKKYPKANKLTDLSSALGVTVEELVSAKMGKKLHPLLEFLESDLASELPLAAFGIGDQDVYDLMSHSPEKFTSFLMTLSELAKSYDLSVDELNKAALRAHVEMNQNHFPLLEQFANSLRERLKSLNDFPSLKEWNLFLKKTLSVDHSVKVDLDTLGKYPDVMGIKSLFKDGLEKILFLNPLLSEKQVQFEIVKELGSQLLSKEGDQENRNADNQTFSHLLLNFHASYVAAAILVPEESLARDLQYLFSFASFSQNAFKEVLEKYSVPPEVLIIRITQLLPKYFNFDQLFFLRCNENLLRPRNYHITQELHLGRLHHPHGVSLTEHYCRRWITTQLLAQEITSDILHVGAQISQMGPDGTEYFCLSMAKKSTTNQNVNSCFTLGLPINANFKEKINFSGDSQLERRVVGRTCERCSIEDCDDRVVPSDILSKQRNKIKKEALIKKIISE